MTDRSISWWCLMHLGRPSFLCGGQLCPIKTPLSFPVPVPGEPSPWRAPSWSPTSLHSSCIHACVWLSQLSTSSVLLVTYLGVKDEQGSAPFSVSHLGTCIISTLMRDKAKPNNHQRYVLIMESSYPEKNSTGWVWPHWRDEQTDCEMLSDQAEGPTAAAGIWVDTFQGGFRLQNQPSALS